MAPIWWNEQTKGNLAFSDNGFWVVTKHEDVKAISRRSEVFCSNEKTRCPATRRVRSRTPIEFGGMDNRLVAVAAVVLAAGAAGCSTPPRPGRDHREGDHQR